MKFNSKENQRPVPRSKIENGESHPIIGIPDKKGIGDHNKLYKLKIIFENDSIYL